ncbi:twinkle protein, mitochondrial-like isoform X3 [Stegodyphus dumicola]|uniref:twinkle protein, mitochondrial-like isoform X3 n=1 Tax=Stegodyphus dumicola TaxID=202533 RepID=UPI0015A79B66|nr:twinkle protein, mitochondrial-like isoform X3 [Stegodyphus dumicola]
MFQSRIMCFSKRKLSAFIFHEIGIKNTLLNSNQFLKMKRSLHFCPAHLCSSIPSTIAGNKLFCDTSQACLAENHPLYRLYPSVDQAFFFGDLSESDLSLISERFALKGLNIQYFHKYNIKISSDMKTVLFPFDSLSREFSAIQSISYKNDDEGKRVVSDITPKLNDPVLFGWSLVGSTERVVVVTSDPLDAIAVNQETDLPVISLPYNFKNFSPDILSALKPFAKVIFWLKPHLHDWETHKILGNHLGKSAFFIRPSDFQCALLSLQNDFNLRHILREAYPMHDEDLETFDSYVGEILEELKGYEKAVGLKWKRFFVLNELLKGHRRGELTIFSGQTGTGKTTFMSEYSLDLCAQGRPTLWASFEISNVRLMKTMLLQYSRCSLSENIDEFDYWSEEFRKLPMFFLNFHGPRSLKKILKAMTNAVIVYDVQHVVVDNLQFMMNMEDYNSSLDQYRRQDQIYSTFRDFASRLNCHVTLVIHPRKEPEYSELNNTSISGTAKATQEADNIIILQTTKNRQYLQVIKK